MNTAGERSKILAELIVQTIASHNEQTQEDTGGVVVLGLTLAAISTATAMGISLAEFKKIFNATIDHLEREVKLEGIPDLSIRVRGEKPQAQATITKTAPPEREAPPQGILDILEEGLFGGIDS